MGDEEYEAGNIYQGAYSSFKPLQEGISTGYHIPPGRMGTTTDPRNADILSEVSQKIGPGQKAMEVELVSPEIVDSIPKQQFKEINRLSKLTGVDISVHGPVMNPAGITQQGYSETSHKEIERQMFEAVKKSHELDPDGNIPVTFHSAEGLPAPEMIKGKDGKPDIQKMLVINQDTGQITAAQKEVKHFPGMMGKELEKGKPYTTKEQLKVMNDSEWSNSLSQAVFHKEGADRILSETSPIIEEVTQKIQSGEMTEKDITPSQEEAFRRLSNAKEYLKNTEQDVTGLFNRAYKYAPEKRDKLKELSRKFAEELEKNGKSLRGQSHALQGLMEGLQEINPEVYKPLNDFAKEKTTTTFANLALKSYKEFGDNAPIISVENPPAGFAFSTGEDLKEIVEESREKFIKKATDEGMSKSQAEKQAEKLLGVTWDVGHINMLRKQGFEEKDIVKESEKIAPYLKHVHLSDNFGFEHTELPMGMGNVPLKEIMDKLGKKGFEARKIVEAAQWWQHFKTSPIAESMKTMNSSVYAMEMQPQWNQAQGYQFDYPSGLGATMPSVNYATWGTNFSTLPMELGGQTQQQAGSRFSGQSME